MSFVVDDWTDTLGTRLVKMTQDTTPEEMDAAQESVDAVGPDLPLSDQEDTGEVALPEAKGETPELSRDHRGIGRGAG